MRNIISKNPFTGQIKETFKFLTPEELDQKILRAKQGYEIQRKRTVLERAQLIKRLGECLQDKFKEATETITFEMGKPITDS